MDAGKREMGRTYDTGLIDALVERTCNEVGFDAFAGMGLMAAEKAVRSRDAAHILPGKTLLRERINNFRSARWPHTAPKKLNSRSG
jgi:hypothetical protein